MNINETLDNLVLSAHAEEFMNKNKLNWNVSKTPLFATDGSVAPAVGIQRSDNSDIIGVVSPRYQPLQNSRLVEIMQRLADRADLELASAKQFNGGSRISIQLRTGDLRVGNGVSKLNTFITAINSHDGSTGVRFGNSNTDISCMNTFFRAYRELKEQFSFRHTTNLDMLIDDALFQIDRLRQAESQIAVNFERMAEADARRDLIRDVVKNLVGFDRSAPDFDESKWSAVKLNQHNNLVDCILSEMREKGENRWGLFSGVTKYTTHQISAPKRENGRDESKLFGTAQAWDAKAYKMLALS